MKCRNCGNKVDKSGAFCEKCGAPVEKKSKTPLYIGLIAGIIVLAIVAVVGILVYNTGAYDRQIELGYELLNDGKYEEAILAFDKAIEIEEKRPEGYMGKAESMAHDPEMTPEKAEEIVEVLEEGYKKSGDKKVIEHRFVIVVIIRENGFSEEAYTIEDYFRKNYESEDLYTDESIGEISDYMVITDDHVVVAEKDFVSVLDKDLGNETVVFNGSVENDLLSMGEYVYAIKKEKGALTQINPIKKTAKNLVDTNPDDENKKVTFIGGGGGYIYVKEAGNSENDYDTYMYNLKTKKYELLILPVIPDKISVFNGKIYFAQKQQQPGTEIISLYEANPDGSDAHIIIEDIICYYDIIDGSVHYFDAIKPLGKYIETPIGKQMPFCNLIEVNLKNKERAVKYEDVEDIYKNVEILFTDFGMGESFEGEGAFFEYHSKDYYKGIGEIVPDGKELIASGKDFVVMDTEGLKRKVGEEFSGPEEPYYRLYTEDKKSQIFCEGEIISVDAYDNGRIYYRLYNGEDKTSYERKYLDLDLEPLEED